MHGTEGRMIEACFDLEEAQHVYKRQRGERAQVDSYAVYSLS